MNQSDTRMKCEQALDLLDSLVAGELDSIERAALELHLVECAQCAAELALARRLSDGLDSLDLQKCPATVTDSVFAYAAAHPMTMRRPWWWQAWRPVLAGAVAMILVIATGYVGQNGKQVSPQYTRSELEQARAQAKWTLVFINQLSRRTAADLKHDVLTPHVSQKLLHIVNPNLETAPKENKHAG